MVHYIYTNSYFSIENKNKYMNQLLGKKTKPINTPEMSYGSQQNIIGYVIHSNDTLLGKFINSKFHHFSVKNSCVLNMICVGSV